MEWSKGLTTMVGGEVDRHSLYVIGLISQKQNIGFSWQKFLNFASKTAFSGVI